MRSLVFSLALSCSLFSLTPAQARNRTEGSELRERFGEHADDVLTTSAHVTREGGAFRLAPPGSELSVSLPFDAHDGIEIGVAGSVVRVREAGLRGRGERIEGTVSYEHDVGRSYFTEGEGGLEEWLDVRAGLAFAGREIARWELEGATLRVEDRVVVVGVAGRDVLRVTAPRAWARGGRAVDVVLGVDGDAITLAVDADGEAVLVDPLWVATGSMTTVRSAFFEGRAAVLLASGRVLVAGGIGPAGVPLASAELYDPATGTWTATGSLSAARYGHSITVLGDGRVLVAGGSNSSADLATTEIYDPATGVFTGAAPMGVARSGHSATVLSDGRVLVAGGYAPTVTATATLYNPTTNAWSAAGSMPAPRAYHAATRLADGRVLAAGGDALTWLADATVYSPVTNTWAPAGTMSSARQGLTATLLPSGRVLVVGGSDMAGITSTADVYDPVTNLWTPTMSMSGPRRDHTATLLSDGRVLVAAGRVDTTVVTATTLLWDPVTGTWSSGVPMSVGRSLHSAVVLAGGRVLVAGGRGASGTGSSLVPLASAEIYTSCGDGVLGADESCDDGNRAAGDCCSPTCTFEATTTECRASVGACDLAEHCTGTTGVCPGDAAVVAGTACGGAPSGDCDAQDVCAGTVGATASCDARFASSTTSCGTASCTGGIFTSTGTCDGAGVCGAQPMIPCAPFACGAVACFTSCTSASECAAGLVCTAGVCGAPVDAGTADAGAETDAGEATDAGGTPDAGGLLDAGVIVDGGVRDAAPSVDARPDATVDAGTPAPPADGGCACSTRRPSAPPWALGLVLAVVAFVRRRSRGPVEPA